MKKFAIIFSCICFLLTGCSSDKKINVHSQNDQEKKELEQTLKEEKEIYAGSAIFVEDELLVAIQVNPWIGFKERKIEKKLQKKLEKQYPSAKILVSTDYKLFWESNQLMEEQDKQKIVKEIKKLKDLAKEET